MFDFIRSNTRVLFFILLVLIIPSFIFVGVDGYRRMDEGSNVAVAKVQGQKISQVELEAAIRQQGDRIRSQRPDLDPALLDGPEFKQQVLDELVRQKVVTAAVNDFHLVTTDERLKRLFSTDPQFASVRNPDGTVNKEVLATQGMSSDMFAQRLRQDLSMQQVFRGVAGSAVATTAVTQAALDPLFQQRQVQVVTFPAQRHLASVKPTDAQIEAFYADPANAARFKAPEQADIEFVVLDVELMKKGISVSADDLQKFYDKNIARFTTAEQRRASHVLVKAGSDASSDDKAKAKAKAQALLEQIRAKPSTFADVARKNSDDTVSAERGGDLDFFGRGDMTPTFEKTVFEMKNDGDISNLVETEFGFHIIQLTGKRGGEKRALDTVRSEIESELRAEQAQKKFTEAAVDFSNMVYEQAESLKPVSDKYKLDIQTAKAVTRDARPDPASPLANKRFIEQLFADDAVRNKRNTEAIDLGAGRLVAGRVAKHTPSRLLPLEEVRESVRGALTVSQAAALSRQDGEAKLAALKAAPDTVLTESTQKISRLQRSELAPALLDAIMRAPAAKLPSVVGVDLGDQGYAVIKVVEVLPRDPVVADPERSSSQYRQTWADAEAQAYYAGLKKRFKVDIKANAVAAAASAAN
ncbi:MAG: peptidylprolyl isomerase [Pseudomonadota bacterium]|jgi:peptidyl-prolyl cis-trans isomerase D